MKPLTCNHCPAVNSSGCLLGYKTEPICYFNNQIGWRPLGSCIRPVSWEEVLKTRKQQRDSRQLNT